MGAGGDLLGLTEPTTSGGVVEESSPPRWVMGRVLEPAPAPYGRGRGRCLAQEDFGGVLSAPRPLQTELPPTLCGGLLVRIRKAKLKIKASVAPDHSNPPPGGDIPGVILCPKAETHILSRIPLKLIAFACGDARCLKTQLTCILFSGCGDTDLSWRTVLCMFLIGYTRRVRVASAVQMCGVATFPLVWDSKLIYTLMKSSFQTRARPLAEA